MLSVAIMARKDIHTNEHGSQIIWIHGFCKEFVDGELHAERLVELSCYGTQCAIRQLLCHITGVAVCYQHWLDGGRLAGVLFSSGAAFVRFPLGVPEFFFTRSPEYKI